jgi:hypothetical protein
MRIVEADIWDHRYLDLCGPATIVTRANRRGGSAGPLERDPIRLNRITLSSLFFVCA